MEIVRRLRLLTHSAASLGKDAVASIATDAIAEIDRAQAHAADWESAYKVKYEECERLAERVGHLERCYVKLETD